MANEKRLVNAEAIARKLKYAYCTDCNVVRKIQCSACWVGDVLELLEGDSVDSVEVVHGRWEEWWPGISLIMTGEEMLYRCSACDAKYADIEGYKYCPNCGAKMDGESKTNEATQ